MRNRFKKSLKNSRLSQVQLAIGSFIVLVLSCSLTSGQDISIIANVDRNIIELGETINFSISVSGSVRSISKPSLPDLSDFDVYSSGTSSNISIVPGAVSYQTDYSYVLVPRKPGTFVIGSAKVKFKGQEYSTQPIQIKVNPPSQSKQIVPSRPDRERQPSIPASENRDFFIEQVVDNHRPYVGEQVTMVFSFIRDRTCMSNLLFNGLITKASGWRTFPHKNHTTSISMAELTG